MPQPIPPSAREGAMEANQNRMAGGPPLYDNQAQAQATQNARANTIQATNPMGGQDQRANNLANGASQGGLVSPEQAMAFEHTAMAMINPLEILKEQSEMKENEVSLDALSKKQKDKILHSFLNCKKVAKNHYETVIEPRIKDRREIYEASAEYYEKVFPQLSEMCKWTSKDVKTVCDWILPGLMEAFTGSEYPLSIKGVNVEDDERAEKIQQLITYQLERKNSYQPWVHAECETALRENWAIAKVYWNREEEHTPMEMMLSIDDGDGAIALSNAASSGKVNIKKMDAIKDAPDFLKVEYDEIKVKANHPVIEYLPSSEFRYTPDAPLLCDCKFVAQRKIVTGDYLKRKEIDGIYKNIDKALEEYGEGDIAPTSLDQDNDLERSDKSNRPDDEDNASKEVELYEAYINVDYNDDGVAEKLIVHAVGENLIRVAQNDFEIAPFFVCCTEYDHDAVFPKKSFAEYFKQQQDLKTAMVRQVIVNTSKNNAPRVFVNEQRVDMDALISGDEIIPTQGNPNELIATPPSLPLSSVTMEMINYAQNEIEAQSGSTRYNQGLDSNSLNNMLALDTPIPMADGSYKMNGDIVEGDMLVGRDGKPTKVLKAHPVHMPEKAFELKFTSNEVIRAGTEHRWMVKVCDKNYKHLSPDWEVLTTGRIYELMQTGHKVRIPRVGPVEYPEKDLPIDPYVFGLWLGDGNAHTNRFTTMDEEIKNAFEQWAKKFYKGCIEPTKQQRSGKAINYQIKNTPFREMLKDLHVLKDGRYEECKNNVKHIPEIYLRGSFEQRLALLQGLMDTDGCITKDGQAVFCNSEPALIEGVTTLIESLGGAPNVRWRRVKCNLPSAKGKECRLHCHITFSMPYCPVRLKRKVERWKTKEKYWEYQNIVSIKEIPLEPMRCLSVDAEDSAYCCGRRFTVTLNTATGITAIMGASERRNKLMARAIAERFFIPIYKFLIRLNQMYLEDEQMVRLTNKNVAIRKEDLDIDYDLIVNVGQGAGTKEAQIQYIMYTLQSLYPQLVAQGIANSKSYYNLVCKLLEQFGLRDTSVYLMDPDSDEAKQAAQQAQQQAINAQAEALKNSLALAAAKVSMPRVSIDLTAMPPDVQRAYIMQKLGIETTERAIAEHEEFSKND